MASLTSSGVTVLKRWVEKYLGKNIQKVVEAQVALTAMGGVTNTIPASAFGLSYIREIKYSGESTNAGPHFKFVPSYDGTLILAINLEDATDANRGNPADITGNFRFIVRGDA